MATSTSRRRGPRGRGGSLWIAEPTEIVTVAEVARRLGLTSGRIHQMVGEGEMPPAFGRIGAALVWRWSDVDQALQRSGRLEH